MKLKIYQIDAFTDEVFKENPAAVCPLEEWLPDETMQNIALENNLAETVFFVQKGNDYEIRWFTPAVEVDLCGHATLAAAFVLYNYGGHTDTEISFHSRKSGVLKVNKKEDFLALNFPTDIFESSPVLPEMISGFKIKPTYVFKGKTDYMLVFENEEQINNLSPEQINNLSPDFSIISKLNARGVIVTAKESLADFVSRFFAPQSGIDEDPVTGSAHTTLIPYWSKRLGKNELSAIQLSKRKGYLKCKYLNERVEISGQAKTYLIGEIFIP